MTHACRQVNVLQLKSKEAAIWISRQFSDERYSAPIMCTAVGYSVASSSGIRSTNKRDYNHATNGRTLVLFFACVAGITCAF